MFVLPIDARRVAIWREMEQLEDVIALADPTRSLYRALDAARPRVPLWVLQPRTLLTGFAALRRGRRPTLAKGDDALQLGIDAVVSAEGEIVVLHRAASASDRLAPEELTRRIAALA